MARSLGKTDAAAIDYATLMFKSQDDFYGDNLNTTWVDGHIASLASTLGYSVAAFAAGLADDNLNEAARIEWKYSASRYTTGTPHFLINGLPVDDQLGDGSLTAWESLIDPLLTPAVPRAAAKKRTWKH